MQPQSNDVYRTPMQNEAPVDIPTERGNAEVYEATRQNQISEAKADLERYYFAKAALEEGDQARSSVWRAASAAEIERQQNYANEILPYIKHIGEFIDFEREEVVNRGWIF